ncbi:hypothetical protein TNIN_154921, partial [Trichonephila inaurata madagascariensis]
FLIKQGLFRFSRWVLEQAMEIFFGQLYGCSY